jgi:hypothetical protein
LLNDGQYAKLQNALAHLTLCVLNIHNFNLYHKAKEI